jgi:hypothetical protein
MRPLTRETILELRLGVTARISLPYVSWVGGD